MMAPSVSIAPGVSAILGVAWLVLGGLSVGLMFRVYGRRVPTQGRLGIVRLHRMCGAAFSLIYLFFLVVMVAKAASFQSLTPLQAVHMALGVLILPLLVVKVAIARRYKALHRLLPGLGIAVFSLAVAVIFLGAMPYAIARLTAPDTDGLSQKELVVAGAALMEQRCQKCHDLDRVYDQKGKRSPELWAATMDQMVKLEPPLADVREPILVFLQAEFAAPDTPEGVMLTGAALVEARCQKCHDIDRVFSETKTRGQWDLTVRRYAALLPDHIKPGEIEPIVQFLFEKRGAPPDPEAQKRKVFEQHCGRCHNLSRSLEKAQRDELSPKRWKRVVKKMRRFAKEKELGDLWNDEQAVTIAEYLAAQYTGGDEGED